MSEDKFIRLCAVSAIIMFLIWLVILACMGEYSTIPRMIGCFVVGWYLRNIVDTLRDVRKYISKEDNAKSTQVKQLESR